MTKRILLSLALTVFLLGALVGAEAEARQISFKSEDGLLISADLYLVNADKRAPFIVLFHQAGWSRGEYLTIAPKLNKLGFNCMAIDQRSGGKVVGVENLTALAAKAHGKRTTYLHALRDMRAALRYARMRYAKGTLIAWGSSYSASLAMVVAARSPALVDAVIAFSPGEYFRSLGKPGNWVSKAAAKIKQPVFITSARDEWPRIASMYQAIPSRRKGMFRPETEGRHGSRVLWSILGAGDSDSYWDAVSAFLYPFTYVPRAPAKPRHRAPAKPRHRVPAKPRHRAR